jgi:hypothetical protein
MDESPVSLQVATSRAARARAAPEAPRNPKNHHQMLPQRLRPALVIAATSAHQRPHAELARPVGLPSREGNDSRRAQVETGQQSDDTSHVWHSPVRG